MHIWIFEEILVLTSFCIHIHLILLGGTSCAFIFFLLCVFVWVDMFMNNTYQKRFIMMTKIITSSSMFFQSLIRNMNDWDKTDCRNKICIFWDGNVSEETHGRIWAKCVMCQIWTHADCSGHKSPYLHPNFSAAF